MVQLSERHSYTSTVIAAPVSSSTDCSSLSIAIQKTRRLLGQNGLC